VHHQEVDFSQYLHLPLREGRGTGFDPGSQHNLHGPVTCESWISSNSGLQETFNAFQIDATNYNTLRAACYSRSHHTEQSQAVMRSIPSRSLLRPGGCRLGLDVSIDQGRSGRQNSRVVWGKWCNVRVPGLELTGPRLATGPVLIDTVVRVKPGGEPDGVSSTSRRVRLVHVERTALRLAYTSCSQKLEKRRLRRQQPCLRNKFKLIYT